MFSLVDKGKKRPSVFPSRSLFFVLLLLLFLRLRLLLRFQGRPQNDVDGPKAPYAKKGKAIKDLSTVIDYVKPTVLMGLQNSIWTFFSFTRLTSYSV